MPLRVLFPFIGDTVGGSHVSAWQLICALSKLNVEPVILLHKKDGHHAVWLHERRADWCVEPLPVLRLDRRFDINLLKIMEGMAPARKILKKLKIDLVHGNDSRINRAWTFWAKYSGIPIVWHQRVKWSVSIQTQFALPLAKGIVSISNFVAESLPLIKPFHAIIYNPVNIETRNNIICHKKLKEELQINEDVKLIGCFGNSQRLKRPDTLIEAAKLYNQKSADYKIMTLWFGDDRDGVLTKLLGSEGHSSFVKHLPFRSDVLSVIAGCDIVVAPSENDAFGRTIVEAMNVEVPVVASAAGGHLEIIDHEKNGLLFPVGDADACAKEVIKLLYDEKLTKKLVIEGRRSAMRFNPEKHAREVLIFYNQLINPKTKKGF